MLSNLVLEMTLESPLDRKEIKPVNPTWNQPRTFVGRTAAEAEALILWPPNAKSRLTGKDSNAGKDWGQEGKGTTEDEMVGWHHRLNGHEFEQTPGDGEGQRSSACCSPWGHKESDTTEQLNRYVSTWVDIKTHDLIVISPIPVLHQKVVHSRLTPFLICNFFL